MLTIFIALSLTLYYRVIQLATNTSYSGSFTENKEGNCLKIELTQNARLILSCLFLIQLLPTIGFWGPPAAKFIMPVLIAISCLSELFYHRIHEKIFALVQHD